MRDESGSGSRAEPARPDRTRPEGSRWEQSAAHAAILRDARLLAGLSQRALASRMGLSWVTVRQAELGRDLRHGTMERFLAALPTLSARALLLAEPHGVPPSRLGAWLAVRDLAGFWSRAVSRSVIALPDGTRRESWRVAGLQSLRGSAATETVRRDLMMAACEGSGSALPLVLLAAGDPRPETLAFADGDMHHAFRIRGAEETGTVDYHCNRRAPAEAGAFPSALEPADALRLGLFVRATHPSARLRLRLRLPPGIRPAAASVVAWPEALLPGERDLAAELHGGPVPLRLRRDGSDLAFDVEHPLPGTCYAACWDGLADDGQRMAFIAAPPRTPTLAAAIRDARVAASLSRRALAARMGAAEAVVRTAEQGRDVRRSTLQAFLASLPELRPSALLRVATTADDSPLDAGQLERYWLGVFGCEAMEERKIMTVRENGDCEIVHVVRGLRTLPGRSRALRLLDPQQPSYYPHDPPRCRRMDVPDGDAEGIRTRLHLRPDGRVVQEIVLPEALAEQGAAFRREIVRSGVFHVTAGRARALRGTGGGPVQDGAMLYSLFPARRRVLEVRYPRGYWPRRVVARAWPAAAPPYPEHHEAGGRLHDGGLKATLYPAHSRVALRVDRPHVGFKYALIWDLP